MGELDVKLEAEEREELEHNRRNQRMNKLSVRSRRNQRLKQKSFEIEDLAAGPKNLARNKYRALFDAARQKKADRFIDVLESISTKEELSLSTIFGSVRQSGDTLLHVAVSHGHEEIVRLIKDHCSSILTTKNSNGDTVWHIAAKIRNYGIFLEFYYLRESCKNDLSYADNRQMKRDVTWEDLSLRATNKEGNTALHEALIHRNEYMADKLVKADEEVMYHLNNENKSALYLAAEAGYVNCLRYTLQIAARNGNQYEKLKGKPLVHAAIMGRKIDVLKFLLKIEPEFIHSREEDLRTPLHWAASIDFLEGVCYLLSKHSFMSTEKDNNGLLPIHWASMNGHIDVIEKLLLQRKDLNKLLSRDGQNVLHVAANSGRHNVVRYILDTPQLEIFINKRDENGDTPLHLATMHWHSKIVGDLTWDKRVDLKTVNNQGLTALDAAEYNMKGIKSFRQWLTWQTLKAAGAPHAPFGKVLDAKREDSRRSEFPSTDKYKDSIKALLLLSFLAAMVSFKAHSTIPDVYNNIDSDKGSTNMLRHIKSFMFNFCNAIAMSSSIVVAVTLTWANFGKGNMVFTALRLAKPLLVIALTTIALALVDGVFLVVGKLHWLADAVLTMGLVFLVFLATVFFPLCLPYPSGCHILRYITYYPIRLMILLAGSHTGDHLEEGFHSGYMRFFKFRQ